MSFSWLECLVGSVVCRRGGALPAFPGWAGIFQEILDRPKPNFLSGNGLPKQKFQQSISPERCGNRLLKSGTSSSPCPCHDVQPFFGTQVPIRQHRCSQLLLQNKAREANQAREANPFACCLLACFWFLGFSIPILVA